jgi:hypothetical protein
MRTFAEGIVSLVKAIDDEASTLIHGHHAGLVNYVDHARARSQERALVSRLAQLLRARAQAFSTEVTYPSSRRRCDLVKRESPRTWIEVKTAWKAWFSVREGRIKVNAPQIYRSYLAYPLFGGMRRTHSLAADFQKLDTLTKADADVAGVLLVGFDSDTDPMDKDVDLLAEAAALGPKGWNALGNRAVWADRNSPVCRIKCWFWWRQIPR